MSLIEVLKSGNYHLIDVREPMELMVDGKIEEAKNIPLGDLEARKQEILGIDDPLVFFCRSGNRSGKAVDYFKSLGVENIYNGGGYQELNALLQDI